MEFDLISLLWGLPAAFALGWLASRFDLRQMRLENRRAPKAYFRGLNHLLNEQHDQAIDAFIEAVQNDPDTSELHFALGNLFRRRGDYDRAVRVHEHLLARADLSARETERARHALAQDFLKAGLLDRAEAALLRLEGTPLQTDARLARLAIYERTRDWSQAGAMAELLEDAGRGSFQLRLAHYRCEQAATLRQQQHTTEALVLLEQLVQRIPESARAWVQLADLRHSLQQTEGAWDALQHLVQHTPSHLPLVAHNLALWGKRLGRTQAVRATLQQWSQQHTASLDVTQALASLEDDVQAARARYLEHLRREPSLVAANLWLGGAHWGLPEEESLIKPALERACEPLKRYRCAGCGFEARQYFWHCPGCQSWDSYPPLRIEEI
ncbi:predicted N-acetylglucosaminyl transferase [Serpentinimonas raichei]|uniref:Lipopolysaccharide assembly protein B n=1 Tax=Serpentinimonas raichei TaxID=1458425 RepID=A0A060NIR7_9BURK|nr:MULTISPECIES: lipopolysaccharide assembly protein LapB [Serpentinimonas]BAO81277.1 predicted N-acetylglucosaminyl transferase [Serpentinimonas raichei]